MVFSTSVSSTALFASSSVLSWKAFHFWGLSCRLFHQKNLQYIRDFFCSGTPWCVGSSTYDLLIYFVVLQQYITKAIFDLFLYIQWSSAEVSRCLESQLLPAKHHKICYPSNLRRESWLQDRSLSSTPSATTGSSGKESRALGRDGSLWVDPNFHCPQKQYV